MLLSEWNLGALSLILSDAFSIKDNIVSLSVSQRQLGQKNKGEKSLS